MEKISDSNKCKHNDAMRGSFHAYTGRHSVACASMRLIKSCSLMLAVLLLLSFVVFSSLQATSSGNRARVTAGSLGYAKAIPQEDGTWLINQKNSAAAVGEREKIGLPLTIGSGVLIGDKIRIVVETQSLDLTSAEFALIIESDGIHLLRELSVTKKKLTKNYLQCDLTIDSQLINSKVTAVSLFLSAERTRNGGNVEMSLTKLNPSSMDAGTTLRIGEYTVSKQGPGAARVENAAGLSGMAKVDIAYIVSKGGKELIRIMIEGGEVLGLAIYDNGIVAGVEFDLGRKVYVNALTQKQVMSKEELISVFNTLDFSFMRTPDESKWISQQDAYSWNKVFSF